MPVVNTVSKCTIETTPARSRTSYRSPVCIHMETISVLLKYLLTDSFFTPKYQTMCKKVMYFVTVLSCCSRMNVSGKTSLRKCFNISAEDFNNDNEKKLFTLILVLSGGFKLTVSSKSV